MNNLNFNPNLNSQNYGLGFSQNADNLVVPNYYDEQDVPYDTCEISEKEKKREKTVLDKCLTALAWVGGICLGGFVSYRAIEYYKPGTFKKLISKFKKEPQNQPQPKTEIVEKNEAEKTLLQKFHEKFDDLKGDDLQKSEEEFVNNAFNDGKITGEARNIYREKINMRKIIRDFNSANGTQIPLSPYGGVEKMVDAYKKSLKSNQLKIFKEIIKYKIEKLSAKLELLKTSSYYKGKNSFSEFAAKFNRTADLLKSLKELQEKVNNNSYNNYKKVFQVEITPEYRLKPSDDFLPGCNGYKISIENECFEKHEIPLSEDTFKNLFYYNNEHQAPNLTQNMGNCYLVGALNAIISNPTRRCEFYKMFSEDDNSITFTFRDGFKVTFPKDSGQPQLLLNETTNSGRFLHLKGTLGYKMFEEAFALHRLYTRVCDGYEDDNKKKIDANKDLANRIKAFAENAARNKNDFSDLLNSLNNPEYISDPKKFYRNLLSGGTIDEVANILFNDVSDDKNPEVYLGGYHSTNSGFKGCAKQEDVKNKLKQWMKEGKSIVIGRDEFNGSDGYNYNGVTINNSHFSVIKYFNPKTEEVHISESNDPDKVLILPFKNFYAQYSLLYSF